MKSILVALAVFAPLALACSAADDLDGGDGDASSPGAAAEEVDAAPAAVKTEALSCDTKRCCQKVGGMWVCWPRALPRREIR
jgi:hypothetical protein